MNNTAGGSRSADRPDIAGRSDSTYIVGVGSLDAPETEHPSCAGKSTPEEENSDGIRLMRREEDDLAEAWKKTQAKNTYTFRSADSLHFRPGVGTGAGGLNWDFWLWVVSSGCLSGFFLA